MKKFITIIGCILIIAFFTILYFIEANNQKTNLKTIKVAEVTHSVFYSPQYAAISLGYFEEEGLNIDLVLTPGADNVMSAILSGDVDLGLSGSEATIYIYNSGEKDFPITFAQLTQKDGSFIVSREKDNNFTLDKLKGKYIIGGRVAGMPEMTLEWALKEHGINPNSDLTIDTSVAFASMASAFIGGTGDYVTLFEPQATQIVNQGYGYIVASLGELGGIVPYTSYSARKSYINNNKDIIIGFTKAIQKGLDYVNNNSSENIAKTVIKFFPDTSLNDLTKAIEQYKTNNTWPNTTNFSEESFNHLQDIIVEAKQLATDKRVSYSKLVYEQ